ncbi:tRNA (cytosine-5-)-methyltransferase [Hypsizygus marmoreus]|uniref:tRNA (Cytosine-5-)-methyltransferase n=1 Tax=Hypsizygus marmoreus TaxID=39966 RepID=A0A369K959_HYPMA|nr:tRNA (cytosine-5-)-methyltransferase [Hypsizygus marmoreus]
MPVRALQFYCGIGGLHLAFSRSMVAGSVVQAFDWDQTACQVYAANHAPDIVQKVDITTLDATSLVSFRADLWLLSPACQPYTVLNPTAKGSSDPRAKSFLHLIQNTLPALAAIDCHPSRLLIENVAGFETSSTRQILVSTLQSLGYVTVELLITPLQYGIPNSRLRYYLLAKRSPSTFSNVSTDMGDFGNVWRHIPGHQQWTDPRSKSGELIAAEQNIRQVKDYLDEDFSHAGHAAHPNTVPDKVLQKWGRLFDIVSPTSRRTCCFTRGYSQLVERSGSILQTNEAMNTADTFDKFLKAQSEGQTEALHILRPLGLRYFSPSELLRIFDFTPLDTYSTFVWPKAISTKSKYRLIGNSVNVRIVQELINYLFES